MPLLFCCMTRRRAIDYVAVFQKLKVKMDYIKSTILYELVINFLLHTGYHASSPSTKNCNRFRKGNVCGSSETVSYLHSFSMQFPLSFLDKEVMKKVRDFHLSAQYNKKGPNPIHDYIFRLLCLAYLPGKIC